MRGFRYSDGVGGNGVAEGSPVGEEGCLVTVLFIQALKSKQYSYPSSLKDLSQIVCIN